MKLVAILLLFFSGFKVNAQTDSVSQRKRYSAKDLKVIAITNRNLLGDFERGLKPSYAYRFLSKNKYEYIEAGCVGHIPISKGKYRLTDRFSVLLTSKNHNTELYRLYQFDKYLFLVPLSKEYVFKNDFEKEAQNVFKDYSATNFDKYRTEQYVIAFNLTQKYYTKFETVTSDSLPKSNSQ